MSNINVKVSTLIAIPKKDEIIFESVSGKTINVGMLYKQDPQQQKYDGADEPIV